MAHIDYFLFPISPFSYLAGNEMEEVAARHNATITYKPFSLMKVFEATGTLPPGQRHESRKNHRLQELMRIAAHKNLPITLQPAHFPTNPVPAMSAIIAAQSAGEGDLAGLVQYYLRACWADEKDIADDDVVKDGLSSCGFDPKLADSGLLTGSETIERNTNEALERHVFGAPTYLVDDQVFWGQDRLTYLAAYLANKTDD